MGKNKDRKEQALKRIITAKGRLMLSQPFFSVLLHELELEDATDYVTPDGKPFCDTMATDGVKLFYNIDFTLELTPPQLRGVLVHEALHPANRHHTRLAGRDPLLWNIAADWTINPDVIKEVGLELPPGALFPPPHLGRLHAEEYYNYLVNEQKKKQQQPQPSNQGQPGTGQGGQPTPNNGAKQGQQAPKFDPQGGKGKGGATTPAPQGSNGPQGKFDGIPDPGRCGAVIAPSSVPNSAKNKAEEEKWEGLTRSAAMAQSRRAGTMPAAAEHLTQLLNKPRTDYKELLREFIDESVTKAPDWRVPNKRFLTSGIYVPGKLPDSINHVLVLTDVSGSIGELINEFQTEIQSILDQGVADKITVAYFDTQIKKIDEYERGDDIKLKIIRGGGTGLTQPMKWVNNDLEDEPVCIIVFTDLYIDGFGEEPRSPVLWAVYGRSDQYDKLAEKAPYGRCIRFGP